MQVALESSWNPWVGDDARPVKMLVINGRGSGGTTLVRKLVSKWVRARTDSNGRTKRLAGFGLDWIAPTYERPTTLERVATNVLLRRLRDDPTVPREALENLKATLTAETFDVVVARDANEGSVFLQEAWRTRNLLAVWDFFWPEIELDELRTAVQSNFDVVCVANFPTMIPRDVRAQFTTVLCPTHRVETLQKTFPALVDAFRRNDFVLLTQDNWSVRWCVFQV